MNQVKINKAEEIAQCTVIGVAFAVFGKLWVLKILTLVIDGD